MSTVHGPVERNDEQCHWYLQHWVENDCCKSAKCAGECCALVTSRFRLAESWCCPKLNDKDGNRVWLWVPVDVVDFWGLQNVHVLCDLIVACVSVDAAGACVYEDVGLGASGALPSSETTASSQASIAGPANSASQVLPCPPLRLRTGGMQSWHAPCCIGRCVWDRWLQQYS
jgi:hypothetical protein